MSIAKIGEVELAYRSGVWYYGEKGRDGLIVKTNKIDIISSIFLSQGKAVPYDVFSRLMNDGTYDKEWERMSNTYVL